jgi:alcohol dehydrogenase (cytochrome c)
MQIRSPGAVLVLVLTASLVAVYAESATVESRGAAETPATVGRDWPSYNGNLQGTRYSSLSQLTAGNAAKLKQVCSVRLEPGAFQAEPLVVGGTMYVSTSHKTYAFDPRSCAVKWTSTYAPKGHETFPVDRGIAIEGKRLFRGTTDAHLLALDTGTGKTLWDVAIGDGSKGEFASAAPIAWHGTVYEGIAGSDWGVKGRVMAFESATGKIKWTFTTIADGRDPNAKSWPDAAAAEKGGGGTWTSYTLDPATGTLYVPIGNPAPDFVSSLRKGANLYTDSLVALEASSGALQWYVQMTPHDIHDWDMSAPPVFFTTANGKRMLGAAGKDGHLYGIDVEAHKVVYDRPQIRMSAVSAAPTVRGKHICPGATGGAEWSGPAYDVKNGLLITPMDDWCATYKLAEARYIPGQMYIGGFPQPDPFSAARGMLTATDPATGAVKWKYTSNSPMLAGTTPTAGGVTLTGDMAGNLLVFDSANGKVLLKKPTQGSIAGGVITYAVDGKQYVAATSGNISRLTWGNHGIPTILVYSL